MISCSSFIIGIIVGMLAASLIAVWVFLTAITKVTGETVKGTGRASKAS